MKRLLSSTLMVAAAALAGCDQSSHNITAPDPADDQANVASAAPVTLPPAIAASKTYRCKDNSLVYIDWYSDGTARVKKSKTEVGTAATAEELKGDAQSASVTANGQTCHA
jgi:hypothetical protein